MPHAAARLAAPWIATLALAVLVAGSARAFEGIVITFPGDESYGIHGSVCRRIVDPTRLKVSYPTTEGLLAGDCRLGKAVLLCEPAYLDPYNVVQRDSEGWGGVDPYPHEELQSRGEVRICYRLACKGARKSPRDVLDPIGDHSVETRGAELFCVKALSDPPRCQENAECGESHFCKKRPGHCEEQGLCVPRPSDCSDALGFPGCGCDGVSYPDSCDASAAGASLRSDGVCPSE
jgi:hypothetical protein